MAARGECRMVIAKLVREVCSRAARIVATPATVDRPAFVLAAVAVAVAAANAFVFAAVAMAVAGAVQVEVPTPKAWRTVWTSRPAAARTFVLRDFLLLLPLDDANRGESDARADSTGL